MSETTTEKPPTADQLVGRLMGLEACRDAYQIALNALALLRVEMIKIETWRDLIMLDGVRDSVWELVDKLDTRIAEAAAQVGDEVLDATADRRIRFRTEFETGPGIDIANEVLAGLMASIRKIRDAGKMDAVIVRGAKGKAGA